MCCMCAGREGGEASSRQLCGGSVKSKYLHSNVFQFSRVCFCLQRRTRPVMACLGKARGLRMWQHSPPLHHPQKSAYWSFHPRFCLILQQMCSMSGSLRSGPACRPCLRYRWTQWWGAQIRKGGLSSLANQQNKKAHLQGPHLHSPLLHLYLYRSLTRWQMLKARPRGHQTPLLPKASCLHPLEKTVLRCLQGLNQNCEYTAGPLCLGGWGLTTGLTGPSRSEREVNTGTKAFPLLLCCISAASCLPQWVCWLLPVCGYKQISVGFAGRLRLCPSDSRLHVQPRTGPPRTDLLACMLHLHVPGCRHAFLQLFYFLPTSEKKKKQPKNMHSGLVKALNCVGVCERMWCVFVFKAQKQVPERYEPELCGQWCQHKFSLQKNHL